MAEVSISLPGLFSKKLVFDDHFQDSDRVEDVLSSAPENTPSLTVPESQCPMGPREPITISSLPVELLDSIFKIAHAEWLLFTIHPELYCHPNGLNLSSWRSLMRLFCHFPYIPAAVCRHWRQIVLATPTFWTRPVVFVDSKDPLSSLANFRTFIQRSQDLPIVVAIVRKAYNVPYDLDEGINVALIMDVLLSNLHRFQDIYFHLNQSSSLPSIVRFLHKSRPLPNFVRLALHCDIDDVPTSDNRTSSPSLRGYANSSLTTLKIDGRNLMALCLDPSASSSVLSQLKCLTLERLQCSSSLGGLSILSALQVLGDLPHLETLTIRDVQFEISARHPGSAPITINVSDLILEDLNCDVVKSLFNLASINPTYLLLRNIPIDALPHVPQPLYLELAAIDVDQDLEDLLCFWDGEVLAIRACPGFDDSLLALFAEDISPPYHISPSLRELHIQDCANFTGSALRRMVEMRLDFATRPENAEMGLGYISEVYVCGTGPVLSNDDASWFRSHINTFIWSTLQPSGGSCHLDEGSSVPFTLA